MINRKNRVFTYAWQRLVVAGGGGGHAFTIPNNNNEAKLISLAFDIHLWEETTLIKLPLEMNTTQNFYIMFGSPVVMPFGTPGAMFASPVMNATAGSISNNGDKIVLYSPAVYHWDSFFILNSLLCVFEYSNLDMAQDYRYCATVIIELEDYARK
jgi:hypothetical protein